MAFTTTLIRKEERARGTLALHLEKPDDFVFKPGQSIDLALEEPSESDDHGNARTFTIASAPHEPDLVVATRLRDTAYKRSLERIENGASLSVDGPFGSMTLHSNTERPAVMLAGGIGITPFRSMLRHIVHEDLPHNVTLIYSARKPAEAAFLHELTEMADIHEQLTFIPTMTNTDASEWDGFTRRIDAEMLQGTLEDLHKPVYYIAGPPKMVKAVQQVLDNLGIDEDEVRFEEFAGY